MLVLALALRAIGAQPLTPNQVPMEANDQGLRFAVAHQHASSWCYGYLYVTGNQLRYEVTQPSSDAGHSFAAERANAVVSRRTLWGMPNQALNNFINIKINKKSYNFLWLANEWEVKNGSSRRMSPPQAAAPDPLFAVLEKPQAAPRAAPAANAQAADTVSRQSVTEGDVRFAVAHHHQDASWCYGYLYVTHDQIRYEVVQPEARRSDGFAVTRAGVIARRPVTQAKGGAQRLASPHDLFELSSQGATYQFVWLANENDVNGGSSSLPGSPQAAPPDLLINTIQNAFMESRPNREPVAVLPSASQLAMTAIPDTTATIRR